MAQSTKGCDIDALAQHTLLSFDFTGLWTLASVTVGAPPVGEAGFPASATPTDFYQLLAYGQKYLGGAGRMALMYPRTETFRYPLTPFDFGDGLSLEVLHFDLDLECLAGLERLDLQQRRERMVA